MLHAFQSYICAASVTAVLFTKIVEESFAMILLARILLPELKQLCNGLIMILMSLLKGVLRAVYRQGKVTMRRLKNGLLEHWKVY